MDTARQIIRWSIPGWCFFILLTLFIALGSVIAAIPTGKIIDFTFKEFSTNLGSTFLNATFGILLGFAGIPIGYLLYQFHFIRHWRGLPIPFIGWTVSEDRGSEILQGVTLTQREIASGLRKDLETIPRSKIWRSEDIPVPGFVHFLLALFVPTVHYIPKDRCVEEGRKLTSREIAERLEHNWAVALTIWYRSAVLPSGAVDRQVTYMFDIYHSQGAIASTVWVAFVFASLYQVFVQRNELGNALLVILIVNLLITLFVFKVMTGLRHGIWREIKYIMNQTIKLRNANLVANPPKARNQPSRPAQHSGFVRRTKNRTYRC
ncbi:MAG: hypothetical protein FJ009_17395 [Chloroflexi bacterium]|nr:hypothetical protein [Chloroflexota bacterium]